jgi:lipopolysaccharide export LptBFGC system permease protein LptF
MRDDNSKNKAIIKQIDFLADNNLTSSAFEIELYKRLVKPITLVAMLLLSMLFIFGSLRDATFFLSFDFAGLARVFSIAQFCIIMYSYQEADFFFNKKKAITNTTSVGADALNNGS